jgi:histidine phosphotransferase ChpT
MAELLCTRLCHDLTGPIGAVSNGAEFLSEEGFNMQGQAVDLIVSSAFSAVARLQYYRFAYGRVKDAGEASLSDKRQMVEDFFKGSKIVIDWPDQHTDAADVPVSSRMVRMLFNLLIITSGALLKGGTLAIRVTEEAGGKCLSVSASGDAVKWDSENGDILLGRGNLDEMTPKTVQVYMTAKLAEELHVKFDIAANANSVTIRAIQLPLHATTNELSETSHG